MLQRWRVPLAWSNLTHDKRRFGVSVAGVGFAVLLMLVQVGFLLALLDSQVQIIRHLNADLFLVSKGKASFTSVEAVPRSRLFQALAVKGVIAARPFYQRYIPFDWKNREFTDPDRDPVRWPIRVLAFQPDPAHPTFVGWPEVDQNMERLLVPDTALMDAKSKRFYDAIAHKLLSASENLEIEREVSDRSITIVGRFRLGTDFTTDGTLLMTAQNLARFFPSREPGKSPLDLVQVGVIQISPDADRDSVQQALREALPEDDVDVITPEDLVWKEEAFWLRSTPIGFIFGLGLVVGFIVGVVICYQILATSVADHLGEYATLKALGYTNRYVTGVVVQEALVLSILGFGLGLGGGWVLYRFLENGTGLPMQLTPMRAGFVLVLTIAMSALSGFLALGKVRTADPAEVFG
jgi:putative ABC transport system permease protein